MKTLSEKFFFLNTLFHVFENFREAGEREYLSAENGGEQEDDRNLLGTGIF